MKLKDHDKKEDYCVSRRLEILEHTGSVYRLDFQELQNFLFFFKGNSSEDAT